MRKRASEHTVVIVPGLRGGVADHWQALLAAELPRVRCVPALGRDNVDLNIRVKQLEHEVREAAGPVVIVAHSAGTITVAHWARLRSRRIAGALLVTPPDLEAPMPESYPSIEQLDAAGWLPVPRNPLPFRSIVLASRNDPLARADRTAQLAADWGSELADLGAVGHMNPASGFGYWGDARTWIATAAALTASEPPSTET